MTEWLLPESHLKKYTKLHDQMATPNGFWQREKNTESALRVMPVLNVSKEIIMEMSPSCRFNKQ